VPQEEPIGVLNMEGGGDVQKMDAQRVLREVPISALLMEEEEDASSLCV